MALGQIERDDHSLCPAVQSWQIEGGPEYPDGARLNFSVKPTDAYNLLSDDEKTVVIENTNIVSQMINRYFTP